MARRRVPAWPALAGAFVASVLAGCTPLASVPQFESSVRMSGGWSRLPDGPLSDRHAALAASVEGRFLVIGGWSGPPCPADADCTVPEDPALRDGAVFDPATGTWAPIAPAPLPVSGDNAVVLDCALHLLTGEAWRSGSPTRVLRYDLASDTWSTLPAPPGSNARLLAAGNRLLAISAGDEHHSTRDWIFVPDSGEWEALPDDPLGPSFDREAVWADGVLLLTAKNLAASLGSEERALVRLAQLDLDTREWTGMPDSGVVAWSPTVAGDLVVFPSTGTADGGEVDNWGRRVSFGGILDPGTGEWRSLPDPPGDGGLSGEVLVTGERTVVGGHLLDPATGEWTFVPGLPGPGRTAAAVASVGNTIVVWGGSAATENLGDGYLLNLPPTD